MKQDKYPLINNIISTIKILLNRSEKLDSKLYYFDVVDIINNNFKINDKLIKEVINLILETSEMNIDDFIDDINIYIRRSRNRYDYINNINDVVNFFEIRIKTTYRLLTEPINYLFSWTLTNKGYDYYKDLNQKIYNKIGLSDMLLNLTKE
ncbi:MAG: hypothetical protein IKT40_12435 [Bacilli bacterium]|nr:hypothetical protein [Bacilli bacterium]